LKSHQGPSEQGPGRRRASPAPEASAGTAPLWHSLGAGRFAVAGLVLLAAFGLALGLSMPVVHLRRGLSGTDYSVVGGIVNLAEGGNILLALIVGAFSVVFPIGKLGTLVALLLGRSTDERRARVLRTLTLLGRWSMLDVFVIAILVGAVQLGVLSEGSPRPGLYVFGGAILLSMLATMTLDLGVGRPASDGEVADFVERARGVRWLSALAAVGFVLGLSLPLMSVEKWYFWDHEYSVLAGLWKLAADGEPLLAGGVLLFVGALPMARFAGLGWLQWGRPSPAAARAVLAVEKWAMLDVFGLALLIVIVKIGDLASVHARPGFWVLLGAVSLSAWGSWRMQGGARR